MLVSNIRQKGAPFLKSKLSHVLLSLVLALSVAALSGCASATRPIEYEKATAVSSERIFKFQSKASPESAHLVVIRDQGALGSLCNINVSLDKTVIATLASSEKAEFWVQPDQDFLLSAQFTGICNGGLPTIEVRLKPKEEKRYRLSTDENGTLAITRTL